MRLVPPNGYLLDTNLVSETSKIQPDRSVREWFRRTSSRTIFISVISVGELRYGIARLPLGRRRATLETWTNEHLATLFENRVLPFDNAAALIWGDLMRLSEATTGDKNAVDMQIAATAVRHNLVLATRNTKDFAPLGLELVNPWVAASRTEPQQPPENET